LLCTIEVPHGEIHRPKAETQLFGDHFLEGMSIFKIRPILCFENQKKQVLNPAPSLYLSKTSIFLSPNLEPFCILRKFIKDGASGRHVDPKPLGFPRIKGTHHAAFVQLPFFLQSKFGE
jgi:hypothetical protein